MHRRGQANVSSQQRGLHAFMVLNAHQALQLKPFGAQHHADPLSCTGGQASQRRAAEPRRTSRTSARGAGRVPAYSGAGLLCRDRAQGGRGCRRALAACHVSACHAMTAADGILVRCPSQRLAADGVLMKTASPRREGGKAAGVPARARPRAYYRSGRAHPPAA